MPQNKQMKIQWITVNGRQVPLVLPQTYNYDKDDWVITSDKDPLAVGNYVQTESGVRIPQKGSDDGAMHAKIVDQNGNPIDPRNVEVTNFPTNQNVTDAEVKAELEQIKATQAEILERLNEPIDTQVIGSIDELDVIVKGTSLTKKFVNLDKRNLNLESGQSVVISYYADNGEIWRPSHAYIEIAPPVDSIDEHGRGLILNPFNSYRSINLGPTASTSEKSYLTIRTKGDEEVANWFQTLVMTDSSGFSARITNNSDGIVNTVLGGMVVEVINDENR